MQQSPCSRHSLVRGYVTPLSRAQFGLRLPLPQAALTAGTDVVGRYMLTYMDGDCLVGRAQAAGGVFIFDRAPNDEVPR